MATYIESASDSRDERVQGRLAFIAQREAAEAERQQEWAALREQSAQQRQAEQAALDAARREVQDRPPSAAETVSGDIREAVTGSRARSGAADSVRAKTRDLIAIRNHRNQAGAI
jgi:hypothetical protein